MPGRKGQEFYRRQYRLLTPDWEDSLQVLRTVVGKSTADHDVLVDLGCGHSDFLSDQYARSGTAVGIDPDRQALRRNGSLRHLIAARAEALPLANESVDVVVAAWLVEHLEDPGRVFADVYRVLRPGGRLIFLTPNIWNYNVWLIRLIPNRLHEPFTRGLYGRQERDTYPVRYRMNSVGAVGRVLAPLGFQGHLILNGDPSYISFNRALFGIAYWIERALDLRPLQKARVHLIGLYEKPTATRQGRQPHLPGPAT